MECVKTAISIDAALFKEIERLAHQMHLSRSQLFARAVKDFVKRQTNRDILEQLNKIYSGEPDIEERARQRQIKKRYRRLVEGEW